MFKKFFSSLFSFLGYLLTILFIFSFIVTCCYISFKILDSVSYFDFTKLF